jgi:isoleucyl-tRNA synthetase
MRDRESVVEWERLIKIRERVVAEIEPLRKDKRIGSSLQAKVVLAGSGDEMSLLQAHANDLPMLFIVSDVELRVTNDAGLHVTIEEAGGTKCDRCWRYVPTVSTDAARPGICDRCRDALAEAA